MTIELNTFKLTYDKPLEPGLFLAGLRGLLDEAIQPISKSLDVYGGVAQRIIRERNEIVPGSARWDFVSWAGLYIKIDLNANEAFDILHDYFDYLSFQTLHAFRVDRKTLDANPKPEDFPELKRRAWTFHVGDARCTLAAFANTQSEICKVVEVGTQPKYELVCAGSPIPGLTA